MGQNRYKVFHFDSPTVKNVNCPFNFKHRSKVIPITFVITLKATLIVLNSTCISCTSANIKEGHSGNGLCAMKAHAILPAFQCPFVGSALSTSYWSAVWEGLARILAQQSTP